MGKHPESSRYDRSPPTDHAGLSTTVADRLENPTCRGRDKRITGHGSAMSPMRTRMLMAPLLLIPLSGALLLAAAAQHIDLVPTAALVVPTGLVGMLIVCAEG